VALVSYVVEGPLKAVGYALALPFTRAVYRPENLIGVYRASNLVWTWALFAAVLGTCRRVGGWRAALLCLGLLVPDHSLVYLGLTDLARPLHLIFGLLLLGALCRHLERPGARAVLPIALITLLGEWDRVDFLWFMAAGAAACLAVDVLFRRWTTPAVLAGYVVGLGLTYVVVPQYLALAAEVARHGTTLTDLPRAWVHLRDLMVMMDPWGAYRRHLDVTPHLFAPAYVAYRWGYVAACIVVPGALGLLGLSTRRPAYVVVALVPALLLGAVAATAQSYEVHHVTVVKPALYVTAVVLAAHLTRWKRGPALAAWTGLAAAALWVQAQAFVDVTAAAPTRGIYGVTWNMSDAWQAAARSDAGLVVGVDFGVWVPGVLSSPPTQRWESTGIPDQAALDQLMGMAPVVGFVVRADGPNAWILDPPRYHIVAREEFHAHAGDPWAFLTLAGAS
jgi:hypothetical protein